MCKVLSWNKISEVQILMILITNHYFCLKMFLLFQFQWQWMSKKCVNFISATLIFQNNLDTIFQFFRHNTLTSSWYCDVKPTRYVRLKMSIFRSCTPRPWCPMSPSPLSDWCHAWSPPRTTTSAPVTRPDMRAVFDDVQDGEHNIFMQRRQLHAMYLCLLYYSTFFKERKIAAQNTVLTHSEHCQTWLMSRMSHSAMGWAGLQWPAPEPTARIMKRLCVPPPAPLAAWSLGDLVRHLQIQWLMGS